MKYAWNDFAVLTGKAAILAAAVATSATLPMAAFADGEEEEPVEPVSFRVTSDALPFNFSRINGTVRSSSGVLATRLVTYRAGETVTLTAPDGTAATVVANAADAGGANLVVGAGGDLSSDGLWRLDNSNGGTAFFGVAWGTLGEWWRQQSGNSALMLDTIGEGPDRKLKKAETPPVAYSGDDWKGDLAKAATVTFTPPEGSGLTATTWNRSNPGTGAAAFTFNAKGVWTVTLTFANNTPEPRIAHITIESAGFVLIVR